MLTNILIIEDALSDYGYYMLNNFCTVRTSSSGVRII